MTDQLALFASPAVKARRPAEPIVRSALVEGDYRWDLRRQWGPGPCIGWVGLNPSTADGVSDDPTMWREMSFSNAWGYGSLIKVNLYPFRSSDPGALTAWWSTPGAQLAFDRNIREATAALVECKTLVAAWGAGANQEHLASFVQEIERRLGAREWMCLGRTADGNPIHTLARGKHRVPDDATLQVWRGSE